MRRSARVDANQSAIVAALRSSHHANDGVTVSGRAPTLIGPVGQIVQLVKLSPRGHPDSL